MLPTSSHDLSPATILTEWARLLMHSLAKSGVEHAVISPGSRSTPFTWAALATPGLVCHSVIDERAAAFFALGQARITGRPSLLICTSGSAAAQYYPAVVEAASSHTPLLLLTADRPAELQDTGANQCLDQVKLFGGFARQFFELGHPDSSAAALDGLMRSAAQAVSTARHPVPGPVHLNAKARKPLEPQAPETPADHALVEAVTARIARGPTRVTHMTQSAASTADVTELTDLCARHSRGLIVCGPQSATPAVDVEALLALSRSSGYPLIPESTSQARFRLPAASEGAVVVGAFDALAETTWFQQAPPDFLLLLGATPTSAQLERHLATGATPYAVVTPYGHHDPAGRAQCLVRAEVGAVARTLTNLLAERLSGEERAARHAYAARWARAEQTCVALTQARLSATAEGALSEPVAVRTAVELLPEGAWLGLGNSLPVREVDAFVSPSRAGVAVWSQRGLSGIDGLVAGALGAASVAGAPSLALLGDVSFLHDVSALLLAARAKSPLALLVLDNGGGRIFETLPVARLFADDPERAHFWLTPPGVDLRHAAALYRLPYERAETAGALREAVATALARPGCTLIHAVVQPDSYRVLRRQLREELTRALDGTR